MKLWPLGRWFGHRVWWENLENHLEYRASLITKVWPENYESMERLGQQTFWGLLFGYLTIFSSLFGASNTSVMTNRTLRWNSNVCVRYDCASSNTQCPFGTSSFNINIIYHIRRFWIYIYIYIYNQLKLMQNNNQNLIKRLWISNSKTA